MPSLLKGVYNQMKTIKYRFWDSKNRCWCGWDIAGWVLRDDTNKEQQAIQVAPKKDDIIPCQFTGLLDRHGKEIYEGDIVKQIDWNGEDEIFQVVNLQDFFESKGYMEKELGEDWDKFEIIGNIYENPELLSTDKDVGKEKDEINT